MSRPSTRLVRLVAVTALIPLPVIAGEIQLPLDNVMTVTLSRPAKTIYIGNPTVADITVVDSRHVFLLGKSFGSTNLIALDALGNEMANEQVVVTDRLVGEVTVQRGVARATMTCTPDHCQQDPAPGDDATDTKQTGSALTFNSLKAQNAKHSDDEQKAATASAK